MAITQTMSRANALFKAQISRDAADKRHHREVYRALPKADQARIRTHRKAYEAAIKARGELSLAGRKLTDRSGRRLPEVSPEEYETHRLAYNASVKVVYDTRDAYTKVLHDYDLSRFSGW